jgi:opacity protein-like surface antigen
MRKIVQSILIVMVAVIISAPALAEKSEDPKDLPWKRGYLSLGAYFATMDSSFSLGESNKGLGIELDVEGFLGLDTSDSSLRIDAGYRFGKTMKHKVDFSWFKFHREGTKFIDEQIEVPPEMGGGTLGPGDFTTKFNFDIYKIKYEYSFVFDERVDLNVGLGLYIMPIEVGMSAVVNGVFQGSMKEDVTAPLPVFGLGFDFAITPKWIIRQQMDVFYLEIGDFKGNISSYSAALEWLTWEHVGFGLGVDSMRVRVKANGSDYPGIDFHGDIKFSYFGAQLYLKAYF